MLWSPITTLRRIIATQAHTLYYLRMSLFLALAVQTSLTCTSVTWKALPRTCVDLCSRRVCASGYATAKYYQRSGRWSFGMPRVSSSVRSTVNSEVYVSTWDSKLDESSAPHLQAVHCLEDVNDQPRKVSSRGSASFWNP
ncbi:hypothetical protein BKA83DRAFT_1357223 [Pisolithus microcarpus]|nr:hypothetical protein BKA83DRAFT_1357223 [Pisolithus microcarpus]